HPQRAQPAERVAVLAGYGDRLDHHRRGPGGAAAQPHLALIAVIGASGRAGLALCASLRADGVPFTPVVRSAARWMGPEQARIADLGDVAAIRAALAGATSV